jgi:hypothetical protein
VHVPPLIARILVVSAMWIYGCLVSCSLLFDTLGLLTGDACLSAYQIYMHEKHFKVDPQTQDQFAQNAFSFFISNKERIRDIQKISYFGLKKEQNSRVSNFLTFKKIYSTRRTLGPLRLLVFFLLLPFSNAMAL